MRPGVLRRRAPFGARHGSYTGYLNANGLCLDNTGNTKTDGTRIQVWACKDDTAQQWYGPSPSS